MRSIHFSRPRPLFYQDSQGIPIDSTSPLKSGKGYAGVEVKHLKHDKYSESLPRAARKSSTMPSVSSVLQMASRFPDSVRTQNADKSQKMLPNRPQQQQQQQPPLSEQRPASQPQYSMQNGIKSHQIASPIPRRVSSQNLQENRSDRPVAVHLPPPHENDERLILGKRSDQSISTNANHSPGHSISSSYETNATSLPALQQKGLEDEDCFQPLTEDDIDPRSFDLVIPPTAISQRYSLEIRSEQLFSTEHLSVIFADPYMLSNFTTFLNFKRSKSIPLLVYYLSAVKAIKAIRYANAIARALEPIPGVDATARAARPTSNSDLEGKAQQAFETLAREDLPAYITHLYTQTVSASIHRRITGTLPAHLREASEGLAEVFCLSDPSRPDNPIVFASEEFHRTTQYGINYSLGRNCRFLQGPKTNPFSVRRIREKIAEGVDHVEVFLNYRRDGSPFMNLLMVAPLCDSRGQIRYFIGAQVDVSGLVKECSDLESLRRLVNKCEEEQLIKSYSSSSGRKSESRAGNKSHGTTATINTTTPTRQGSTARETPRRSTDSDNSGGVNGDQQQSPRKDEFRELSEVLNLEELETVRRFGGRMYKQAPDDADRLGEPPSSTNNWNKPRLLISDNSPEGGSPVSATGATAAGLAQLAGGIGDSNSSAHRATAASALASARASGRLQGIYENYLLVRPYPSLRVLFASPSLRLPGILQSAFLDRIGGSGRVREELASAMAGGQGVTARVRWLRRGDLEGRIRWIHCTPLLAVGGGVGVWMVVLVDDEPERSNGGGGGGSSIAGSAGGGAVARAGLPAGTMGGSGARRRFREAPPVDPGFGRPAPGAGVPMGWEDEELTTGRAASHDGRERRSTSNGGGAAPAPGDWRGEASLDRGSSRGGGGYSDFIVGNESSCSLRL